MKKITFNAGALQYIVKVFNDLYRQKSTPSLRFKLDKIANELNGALKSYQVEMKTILDEYCRKDDQGKYLIVESGDNAGRYDLDEEGHRKYIELLNTEIEIEISPLNSKDLESFEFDDKEWQVIKLLVKIEEELTA